MRGLGRLGRWRPPRPGRAPAAPRQRYRRLSFEGLEGRTLLSGGGGVVDTSPYFEQSVIFAQNTDGHYAYRIPGMAVTNSGVLLAFAEGRIADIADTTPKNIVLKRSFDNGRTWGPMQTVVASVGGQSWGNPTPVVDRVTGRVLLTYVLNVSQVFVVESADDGATWGTPREITSSVKVTDGPDWWGFYATGPSHGIQTQSGRLVIPAYHRVNTFSTGQASWSHVFFSDDHGATWQLGGTVPTSQTNEATLVELRDGTLYMTMRARTAPAQRWITTSVDGGLTWAPAVRDPELTESALAASVVRLTTAAVGDDEPLVFANAAYTAGRERMTVRLSLDETETWSPSKIVSWGRSAYAELAVTPDETIQLLYERGRWNTSGAPSPYQEIALARFNRAWIESPVPYEVRLDFEEQSSGFAPVVDGWHRDSSPWQQPGIPGGIADTSKLPIEYVPGDPRLGGHAARFTASTDWVWFSPVEAREFWLMRPGDSFTLEALVQTSSHLAGGAAGAGVLIGTATEWSTGHWFLVIQDGRLRFYALDTLGNSVDVSSAQPFVDGGWHHVAVVRDAAAQEWRLYVDYALVGSAADPTQLIMDEQVNGRAYGLGEDQAGTRPFVGAMDFFRATRAALAPEEMVQVAPPRVVGVYAQGSAWTTDYLDALGALGVGDARWGFALATGSAQLNALPWTNVDTLRVRFSEPVTIAAADLQLVGSGDGPPVPSVVRFHYDPATHTATWQFAAPLPANKYLLCLAGAGIDDSFGQTLDGEWATGATTQSGNGTAGGAFAFRFRVVPGDVNGDTNANLSVTNADVLLAKQHLSTDTSAGTGFLFRRDVNGNGAVTNADVLLAKQRLTAGLDVFDYAEPVAPAAGGDGAAEQLAAGGPPPTAPTDDEPTDAAAWDAAVLQFVADLLQPRSDRQGL